MLSLSLYSVFRGRRDIDQAVRTFIVKAYSQGESAVEIIPEGEGRDRLKADVLAYLNQQHMKCFYGQAVEDQVSSGRIVVHFK